MICPKCQKEIPDTARACGYCGHWLGGEKPGQSKPDISPTTRLNPPWLWIGLGVVVVALIGGIILFSNSSGQIDTEATVAAAIAATRQAEAVQPIDTPTEKPNDTTTPEPPTATSTPKPTNTPRPTPMPTATIDADPLVYDNFNNPADDGSFNQNQWIYRNDQFDQLAQKDGVLIVSRVQQYAETVGLFAKKYDYFSANTQTLTTPTFFEAKLLLDPDKHTGNVQLQLVTSLSNEQSWFSQCTIDTHGQVLASCDDTIWPPQEGHGWGVDGKPTDYGVWHTFRIELNPVTMMFTYYIDDQMAGSHVPVDAEKLKSAKFSLGVGVHGENIIGHIDDVRIGPVGQ